MEPQSKKNQVKHRYSVLSCMGWDGKGWDYSNFTKGGTFSISLKLRAIWGNLTLHHSCLPLPKKTSFFQFGKVENIHGPLFEKIFLVCFSPLSPQVEQKEDDENFNHLQMYVRSRTFTSYGQKICNMRRIPNELKIPIAIY